MPVDTGLIYPEEPRAEVTLARRVRTLPLLIAEAVERMIAEGKLKAGDRINEAILARSFGTSRGPVREALRSLEHDGLLDNVVNRGMYVRRLPGSEVDEIYTVRAALLATAGGLVVDRITDAFLSKMQSLIDAMEKAVKEFDVNTYYEKNIEFHTILVEQSGNRRLARLYMNLLKELRFLRRIAFMSAEGLRGSHESHREILAALRSRDRQTLERALRDNVMSSRDRAMQSLVEDPEG
ncbi:MAG: FCD domain-containing protein [Acetobacterales bacterium]